MARRYTRDNRGRFASVGATARGGRLRTASGNKRETQTARFTGGNPSSSLAKPKGLKPQAGMSSRLKMRDPNSSLGKFAQRREQKAFMQKMAEKLPAPAAKPRQRLPLPKGVMKGTEAMKTHALITHAGQRKAARAESKALQATGKAKPQISSSRPSARLNAPEATAAAIARRRSRAMRERTSIAGGDFNLKLSTRSSITRSAANAIYNRQSKIAKAMGGLVDIAVVRSGIGVMPGLNGSKRDRAGQLREQARNRVVKGRRK